MDAIDLSLINWSRAQFALTSMYHWLFVPITLGLGVIMAIMETLYVKTGKEEWKRVAKFWMTIFGINFAIGVATGIILEFQFGTNWSNYSWFVGDIFGAPLAIEGIVAFFLEATFISIMFFGWNKVSKRFHLASTWLTVCGATLSALWILIANAWMQHPTGSVFNPDTVRNEMIDFWAVAFSPVALVKFSHAVTSAWVFGSVVVVGVSAWFLLKKRHFDFAKKSMLVGCTVGLIGTFLVMFTGHFSGQHVAQTQPMKLAAMEGLYEGQQQADLLIFGVLDPQKESYNDGVNPFIMKIPVPVKGFLSFMSYNDFNSYVPGINNIIEGGYIMADGTVAKSFVEKQALGKMAIDALAQYRLAKENGDMVAAEVYKAYLLDNYEYFGYGFIEQPEDLVPNVPLVFYSFHIMVGLGFLFLAVFVIILFFLYRDKLEHQRWLHWVAIISIPLVYLCSQAGWLVAEFGRQPWAIQDILPVNAAISKLSTSSVQLTFFLFFVLFTALLVAELTIMFKQIKKGPEEGK